MSSQIINIKRKLVTMRSEVERLGLEHKHLDEAIRQFDEVAGVILDVEVMPMPPVNTEYGLLIEIRGLYHEVSCAIESLGESAECINLKLFEWQKDFVATLMKKRDKW